MFEVVCVSFAFGMGLLVRPLGLPPLVGFLGAGFLIHAFKEPLQLPDETHEVLQHLSHLGVLLLLFTVGLKLKLANLLRAEVIGGGMLHFGISCLLFAPILHLWLGLDWATALLLAVALSFSSTVLAAKVLEAKRELRAFHGRVAIGILIVQDLIALGVLSFAGDHAPSVWALGVFALPLLRPLLHWLLELVGHDELLVLMGMLLALGVGGAGFELVGLSPELGALVAGMLLAGHPRAQELSDSLWSLKEVFLVGFFLQIGMSGLPDGQSLVFAAVLALALPLKAILFFALLLAFKLRARNAFLAGVGLTSYSEFGLIVAAGLLPEWLVPLALAVALSFVISAPLNRMAHELFERMEGGLIPFERSTPHPDEQPASLNHARVLVLGMGRAGTAAYDLIAQRGESVIGIDADPNKVTGHVEAGRNVVYSDAEDSSFWHAADLSGIRAAVLAMPATEASLFATKQLRRTGYAGVIVAHTMYPDQARAIREAGADEVYSTMSEAGVGLAEHALEALSPGAEAGSISINHRGTEGTGSKD
ncbi:potassium efflux transporter [Salinisphaera sp. PC39]|uniref:cation:proton antiporter family protein n=1 Tax=Salinisphaera sp. PC39 TaxID=1304156 RepID=UPI00333FEAB2